MGRTFAAAVMILFLAGCCATPKPKEKIIYVDVPITEACVKENDIPEKIAYDFNLIERGQPTAQIMRHLLVSVVQMNAMEEALRIILEKCAE